jgi:hypothetical protein
LRHVGEFDVAAISFVVSTKIPRSRRRFSFDCPIEISQEILAYPDALFFRSLSLQAPISSSLSPTESGRWGRCGVNVVVNGGPLHLSFRSGVLDLHPKQHAALSILVIAQIAGHTSLIHRGIGG